MFRFEMILRPQSKLLFTGCLAMLLFTFIVPQLAGQSDSSQEYPDRIVLQSKSGAQRTIQCRILDFNGTTVSIKNKLNGQTERYPADMVLETHILQTAAQQAAVEAMKAHNYPKAKILLQQAYKSEYRNWVKLVILESQIQVALATSDYEVAGTRFLQLLKLDPKPRQFHLIPLSWSNSIPAPDSASNWLESSLEPAQLMGVSWLMLEPQHEKRAGEILRRLTRSTDDRIRDLALAQRWRLYIASGSFSKDEIARWETQTEKLPGPFRAGPYFVLGDAFSRSLEYERAASRWLWLRANHHPDHQLTTTALRRAADALSNLGLKNRAQILYTELLKDYPHTKAAQQIRSIQAVSESESSPKKP